MMFMFDSGKIWNQIFLKNKIAEKGGKGGGTYLHLHGHHGFETFKIYTH